MRCWSSLFRPDITVMVDWALKINYLSGQVYGKCLSVENLGLVFISIAENIMPQTPFVF